jgi:hypothetical protein
LLSFYVVQLRDFGGLDSHGGKSLKAREAYAVAQLWKTKPRGKRRRKAGALPPTEADDAPQGTLEAMAGQ